MKHIDTFDTNGWANDMSEALARVKSLIEQGQYACTCWHNNFERCDECREFEKFIEAVKVAQNVTIDCYAEHLQ